MKKFFKRFFCKHKWVFLVDIPMSFQKAFEMGSKNAFDSSPCKVEEADYYEEIRQCVKCNKTITVITG